MSLTIEAIYEKGVLKLIQPIALAEGTRVSVVITTPAGEPLGQSPAAILAAIAAFPSEPNNQPFSNQDHDQVLYATGD
jgi:predicted DNA-binding antitoxin AbrB/MazE fold protein